MSGRIDMLHTCSCSAVAVFKALKEPVLTTIGRQDRRVAGGERRKEVALGDGAWLRWMVFSPFDAAQTSKRDAPTAGVAGRPLLLRRRRRMEHGGRSWWEMVGINLVWMNVNGGAEADVVRSQAATHGDVPVANVCVGNF